MIISLFTDKLEIKNKIVENFLLKEFSHQEIKGKFQIFKNNQIVLVYSDGKDIDLTKAFLFAHSEFSPDFYIYLGTGEKISNDLQSGDIILPNVFFDLDEKIFSQDLGLKNRDNFLKDPIFLENYELQKDYNFEQFGLIIGGINVSHKIDQIKENSEEIRIVYEADTIDKDSYSFVFEAKNLNILDKSYVILGVTQNGSNDYLNHINFITKFLIENISGIDIISE